MSPEHRPGRRGSARTRQTLRDLHNQTWELELLISGTVAIVLAFLPARVDEFYFAATAQMADGFSEILFLLFYFAKLTLYTLIFAFSAHIVVRAFWVALVGLDSIFPRGPRWSEIKLGHFGRKVFRDDLPSIRELIVSADALASVTFAATFSLIAIFLVSLPWGLLFGTAALLAVKVLGLDISVYGALMIGTTVAGLCLAVPSLIDRVRGEAIAEAGGGRLLERSLRAVARLTGLRIYGTVQYTLASNIGSRAFSTGIAVFAIAVVSVFLIKDGFAAGGALTFSADAYDPVRAGEFEVDPRLYEERDIRGQRRSLLPSIPTPVLDPETPYLRVFAPLLPESDPAAMTRVCPELQELSRGGVSLLRLRGRAPSPEDAADVAEALRCRAALWDVAVDDVPVDAQARFFTRGYDGVQGIAWFVDVRDLPTGPHILDVRRSEVSLDPEVESEEDDLPRAYRIPFWN